MAKHLRVLIVEDSEDDALLMVRELERSGYEVAFDRVDTAEALAGAMDGRVWDVVLSDYSMPRFNGLDALRLVREKGLDIPFILVSGAIGEEVAVAAMQAGAHDYVMKDNILRLVPAIERELDDARARQQHKVAEQELINSEKRFRSVVGTANSAIISADRTGTIIAWNQAAERMFGFGSDEAIGGPLTMIMPQRYHEAYQKGIRSVSEGEPSKLIGQTLEFEALRKDGDEFPIEFSLSTWTTEEGPFFTAVISDITRRRQAEDAFAAIIKATSVETGQRFFDLTVEVLSRWLGTDYALVGEVLGDGAVVKAFAMQTPEGVKHEYCYDLAGSPCENTVSDGFCYFSTEVADKFPQDKNLSALNIQGYVGVEVRDRQDAPAGLLCAFTSGELSLPPKARAVMEIMAARVFAEMERTRGQRDLEQLMRTLESKNRELQSIVYSASHDLKSPIVNIHGFSGELGNLCRQLHEVLESEGVSQEVRQRANLLLEEEIPESVHFIQEGALKMEMLIDGLLEVSRIGTAMLDIERLDMNELLKQVVETARFQTKEIGASVDLQQVPDCAADKPHVNRVFSNLLDNALKYLRSGQDGQIRIWGWAEDGHSVYCVEDNGIGIDPRHQAKIFEVFHRLNPRDSVEGDGLGLAIVVRILDRLDGRIWLQSQPDEGSKFFVSLPGA